MMQSTIQARPAMAAAAKPPSVTLAKGDTVRFGAGPGMLWVLESVDPPRFIELAAAPARVRLSFQVSLDEEHSRLSIAGTGAQAVDLGERVHHYCLLTLARRRLEDARRGVEHAGQGWIGTAQLSRMLGMDQPHLNIQLHRARNQLARALPGQEGIHELVERRRGQLRLAAVAFEIVRGSALEGEFWPDAAAAGDPPQMRQAA